MKFILNTVLVFVLLSSNAYAWPTRDHFNEMYNACVTREGGLSNGVIAMCTNEVLTEVMDRIDDRVTHMLETDNSFDVMVESFKAYDQKQRASFVDGIENYKTSTVQVCKFLGFHIGGPANPICVKDLMVDLLTILERFD